MTDPETFTYTTAPVAHATIYPFGRDLAVPIATHDRLTDFVRAMIANKADFTIEFPR